VCSTKNVELVRSLGADQVVDYTQEDFTRNGRTYDLIADVAGGRSWSDLKRVLDPRGTLVIIGAPLGSGFMLGPVISIATRSLGARRGERKGAFFVAQINKPDLATLRGLVEEGKVKPVVERSYELDEVAEAFRYLGTGHVQGKLVITL
jgi:NADPH:quinone reductase-like Zn-dependent oxidoreductase